MRSSQVQIFIVCNSKYFVRASAAQPVGASSFIESIAEELISNGISLVKVGFKRDDERKVLTVEGRGDHHTINFNFSMPISTIQSALIELASRLQNGLDEVVFWYQSGVFAVYHPPCYRGFITHHAPFLTELERKFPTLDLTEAFHGTDEKVDLLRVWQTAGVTRLLRDNTLAAIEFSSVQIAALARMNVPSEKIFSIDPRFVVKSNVKLTNQTGLDLQWLLESSVDLRILSCCARIDGFKNLESLFLALRQLTSHGLRFRALVACGATTEEKDRLRLLEMLDHTTLKCIRIRTSFAQEELIELFSIVGGQALFVFPSVYETFGITPMQASRSGMPVVVKDDPDSIGCLSRLGTICPYDGSDDGLVNALISSEFRERQISCHEKPHNGDQLIRLLHGQGS